ncbi:hypothetical protein [Emticicia sp. BO119]|uniref:hypothetical protein n=1 Tax=Emticicia sp. BO119 TaxID=2757768 RepID=UPI0015F014E2|nr:hypothetical protein [Emticicia sp. BO119]MBA4849489.1 hypothetical protein [Emticicia sp. BO119]
MSKIMKDKIKPFQKLPEAKKVFIFDSGVQGYVETEDGLLHTFASHAAPHVTAESKLDLCTNAETPAKYKAVAAKALAAYRKEGKTGDIEESL